MPPSERSGSPTGESDGLEPPCKPDTSVDAEQSSHEDGEEGHACSQSADATQEDSSSSKAQTEADGTVDPCDEKSTESAPATKDNTSRAKKGSKNKATASTTQAETTADSDKTPAVALEEQLSLIEHGLKNSIFILYNLFFLSLFFSPLLHFLSFSLSFHLYYFHCIFFYSLYLTF